MLLQSLWINYLWSVSVKNVSLSEELHSLLGNCSDHVYYISTTINVLAGQIKKLFVQSYVYSGDNNIGNDNNIRYGDKFNIFPSTLVNTWKFFVDFLNITHNIVLQKCINFNNSSIEYSQGYYVCKKEDSHYFPIDVSAFEQKKIVIT